MEDGRRIAKISSLSDQLKQNSIVLRGSITKRDPCTIAPCDAYAMNRITLTPRIQGGSRNFRHRNIKLRPQGVIIEASRLSIICIRLLLLPSIRCRLDWLQKNSDLRPSAFPVISDRSHLGLNRQSAQMRLQPLGGCGEVGLADNVVAIEYAPGFVTR